MTKDLCKIKNAKFVNNNRRGLFDRHVPASPALEGGGKGHNVKKTPYREALSFRARSFNRVIFGFWILDWVIPCGV